jgi:short-subunit dehydrogenase involved in D-alanine esterification of teichoic acids
MTRQNNTILITGGSSGLGLQMAKVFLERGNTVIICSRSTEKLKQAKLALPKLITYQCDIADRIACEEMVAWLTRQYPSLNMLINNAAIVHKEDFVQGESMIEKLYQEVATNFLAPVMLIKLLYPLLVRQTHAHIINVTTGLVYIPRTVYPFYNSTKAALHAFTQVLRQQLKDRHIKVTEVLFPAVATPWHNGKPPSIAITAEKAVHEMVQQLEACKNEIRVGKVRLLYILSRLAPALAFKKLNALR